MSRIHALLLFAVMAPSLAVGHGAFPESRALSFRDPGDALPLVLSTFGLLIPQAPGDWQWVCEEVASGAIVTDVLALSSGRTLLATGAGIRFSDDLCNWQTVEGDVGFADVAQMDLSDEGDLWVANAEPGLGGGLWRSSDGGATFEAQWTSIFGEDVSVNGFVFGADGTPQFVTGDLGDGPVWWWRDGADWTVTTTDSVDGDAAYALSLSVGGDEVFVALRTGAGDKLIAVSKDGTQRPCLERETLQDFILEASAGPGVGEIRLATVNTGLWTSFDDGTEWQSPQEPPRAGCLQRVGSDFYQCTDNYIDEATLIKHSGDPSQAEPVLRFGEVRETLGCSEDSDVIRICEPLWPLVEVYGLNDESITPYPETPTPTETGDPTNGGGEGCDCESGGAAWLLAPLLWMRRRRGL